MLLAYAESGYSPGMTYTVQIDDRRRGSSQLVNADRFPPRTRGRVVACVDAGRRQLPR
jgi:hypothetical protein